MGLEWSVHNEVWNEKYQELVQYQAEKGNCLVPARYQQNPRLGLWVAAQRQAKKQQKLSKERITKLDAVSYTHLTLPTKA